MASSGPPVRTNGEIFPKKLIKKILLLIYLFNNISLLTKFRIFLIKLRDIKDLSNNFNGSFE